MILNSQKVVVQRPPWEKVAIFISPFEDVVKIVDDDGNETLFNTRRSIIAVHDRQC